MSTTPSNRSKQSANILDRRIPRNPKYENIHSTIDTGKSITKILQHQQDLHASSKQQAGEVFKRMKVSTLVRLIIQVAEINQLDIPKNREILSQRTIINTDRSQTQDNPINLDTTRSTLQSVIRGVGEMDIYSNYQKSFLTTSKNSFNEQINCESDEQPYLIVDIRDKDEFKTNHIISAHHYPASMLSRCTNNESKELLIYKNQKGKIIILYDEDERIGPYAATIMIERGYNNIFLLSGGLKYAIRKFPRGLLTGSCPISWTLPNLHQTSSTKSKYLESIKINHHEMPLGQSFASTIRPLPCPMITFDSHEQFTKYDIEDLKGQSEQNLLPMNNGNPSPRSSIASKQSTRSSIVSQRSNISNISDKPWKP